MSLIVVGVEASVGSQFQRVLDLLFRVWGLGRIYRLLMYQEHTLVGTCSGECPICA